EELDALVAREGSQLRRFAFVAQNARAWVLRNVGVLDAAKAANELAARRPAGDPPSAEPRYAGHLDLVDHELVVGDVAAAPRPLPGIADVEDWAGSMHWRHRLRYRLLCGPVALAAGDTETARRFAGDVR